MSDLAILSLDQIFASMSSILSQDESGVTCDDDVPNLILLFRY